MTRKIVCLCGSTRFKEAFEEANKRETLKGNIVLSVGWYGHCEDTPIPEEQKEKLDELHLDKIRMADEILFLNVGGYLGDSSLNELDFAWEQGKRVLFLEPENLSDGVLMAPHFER
jgi:hypothetical protein